MKKKQPATAPVQSTEGLCGTVDVRNQAKCIQPTGHIGVHSNGKGYLWKDPKAAKAAAKSKAGVSEQLKKVGYCGAIFKSTERDEDVCTLNTVGHDGVHENTSIGSREVKPKKSLLAIANEFDREWKRLAELGACDSFDGAEYMRVRAEHAQSPDEDIEAFIRRRANAGPNDEYPETPDPDEPDDLEMRTLARQHREAREAHAAEVETQQPPLGEVTVHPAADALPMIEGPEFDSLVEDIRANGQRHAIVLDHTGKWLVDGRNRKRACNAIGMEPRFERLPENTNLAAYVISTNLKRRHLNESQRGMIAAAIANLGQGQRKTRPEGGSEGVTQAEAAVGAGVSERTVQRANAVRDKGVPELVDAVVKGKVDLKGAEQVAKLSPKQQRDLIKERVDTSKGPVRGGKLAALSRQETKRETVRNINTGKVKPMPIGQFGVIYADYPWKYENSDQHDGSRGHMGYPPMELDAILAHAAEAGRRAGKDCIIALWVTNLYIPHIGRVVEAYGAEHHTMLTWPKPRAGVGSWPRGQTEHVVIASIGKPTHTLNEISTLLPSWNPARPGEHSSKPAELAELLAKHCSGPFLELFGREQRDQWTVWGAESDKFKGAA